MKPSPAISVAPDSRKTTFWFKNGRQIGVECKRADAPRLTPSMSIALADLKLDHLYVLYPGRKAYTLGRNIDVTPLSDFVKAR